MITADTQVIREAKIEKVRRLQENRYKYFVPNERGTVFSTMVGSGGTFIGLYSAANGVGKTAQAVNMLANMIWPIEGGHAFIKGPVYERFPYIRRIRIVSDPAVVDSIVKEMKFWFPANRYTFTKGRKSYDAYWKTDTGFEIDILTYDQDPKEFESANLGIVWLDEPPPKSIYKACIARLRRGGQLFITATPLRGSEWMYDDIITNPANEAGKRGFVEATVEDACIEHGVRGHLKHEDIQKIVAQYDEDEQQARVYGKFQHLTGLVFKQFSRRIHVIPPFYINPTDFCVYQYLDPHPRTPDAAAWYAVDRRGTKYVIDEMFLKCQNGDEELASRIKEKDSQYRIITHKIDPSALIEDQHRKTSLQKELEKFGLAYEPATKKREQSDRAIANALRYTQVADHMVVAPEVYIFSTCHRHVFELEHYRWDEWTGKQADKHGAKQKPLDKDDHMIENLGRFLHDNQPFISRAPVNDVYDDPNDDPYS